MTGWIVDSRFTTHDWVASISGRVGSGQILRLSIFFVNMLDIAHEQNRRPRGVARRRVRRAGRGRPPGAAHVFPNGPNARIVLPGAAITSAGATTAAAGIIAGDVLEIQQISGAG
jgi:hypothetical protein